METQLDPARPEPVAPADSGKSTALHADPILAYLSKARARLKLRAAWRVIGATARVGVGAFLILALLGVLLPALDLRAVAVLTLLSISVGSVLAMRAARRRCDGMAVVQGMTPHYPGLADELHSLLELSTVARKGRLSKGAAFLILLRQRVAKGLAQTPIARALPTVGARRRLLTDFALSAAALLIVAITAPRLLPDTLHTIRRGPLRDAATLNAPPIIGDLELELRPPEYTALPPHLIPASDGDLRGLAGTVVQLRARSLVGAVRRAELVLEVDGKPAQSLPVAILPDAAGKATTLSTQLVLGGPGSYRLVLWRWTGRIAEPTTHRISIEPDLPPHVELRAAADPLELEVPRPVELGYEVEDDFGATDVSLVYRIGEGPEQRTPLQPERPTPRRARGVHLWETGQLEREAPLPPNTRVSYWVEAKDNDAVSGAHVGRSRALTLVMRGKLSPAEMDRANLEDLIEASLKLLADRLELGKSVPSDAAHNALASLAAQYAKVGQVSPADPATQNGKGATALLRRLTADIAKKLDPLVLAEVAHTEGSSPKIVEVVEQAILALDDLRGRRRLEDMNRIAAEMKTARDQLKRLFDELKGATSDAQKAELKREIERKLTELEAKMAELRRAAAQSEGELPDEFLNREAIAKQDLNKGVDGIREMLARGDMEKAMAELDRMSRSLDQLSSSLSNDLRGQRAASDPAAEKAMAEVENELADLAREERQIEEESRAIVERSAEKHSTSPDGMKALREKLRGKLEQFDKRLAEQEHDGRQLDREDLARARARAKAVARAMEAQNADEAQQMASEMRRITEGMSMQLRAQVAEEEAEAQARVGDGPSASLKRGAKRLSEAESLAREIEAELNKAEEGSRAPKLSDGDRKKMEDLTKRQQAAQQRGEELGKKLGQGDQPGMQMMPQGVRHDVEGAKQSMGESQRQLARPAPGRGAESAAEAAQRLDAARKQVSQARQQGDNDSSSSSQHRDEPVRIPNADDSAAPRAFREELLDAMKRGAPKRFEDQVHKFYEELVR